ncbi:uncharacterized protein isoform X2 [Rhodnius prolixus]|uniref:uncharacterized protein isoform X2 n=1 Tax=Rhodnius prolixus TaxID=13249 RepID=UPI003D189FB7
MISDPNSDGISQGLLGLRCCQLPHGTFFAYLPSFIFIVSYMLCIRQALIIGLPNRNRLPALAQILMGSLLIAQSYEMWRYMQSLIERIVDSFLKGQTSNVHFLENIKLAISQQELAKLGLCYTLASVPILAWCVLIKQHQRFRYMWLDLRRRYRNELGSGRYYLSRPCRELELSPSVIPSTTLSLRRTKSDHDIKISSKHSKPR